MSVRIPFGKKTIIFPYDPDGLADRIFTLLANKGKVSILSDGPTASWESGKCKVMSSSQVQGAEFSVATSVFYDDQQVLSLLGRWKERAIGTKVSLYVPGIWEKELRDATQDAESR